MSMNEQSVTIREVCPEDAGRLLRIYAPYVEKTAVSFETVTPDEEEFRGRIRNTLKRYPYLAAETDGKIVGYTYAGPLKERAAYRWSCETTIYLEASSRGKGIGRLLYSALEERLKDLGIRNLYACIAYPIQEDEYLDCGSARFHAKMGFVKCAEFQKCANKFGRWYNMIWMEKQVADHPDDPPEVSSP